MKTVFISLFEGVEAKNLLRSGVVSLLLDDLKVRVVCITKSKERVAFYANEYHHPRLFYEVIEVPRLKGLDLFFSNLKFALLKTKTTDLKRKMALARSGNYLTYYGGSFLNFLLAHSFFRKIARAFDYRLVRTNIYRKLFEKYSPDLVFMAHLFNEPETHLLAEARRRGVRTLGFINSWDKVTARASIRILPDEMLVFNQMVKDEVSLHNDMDLEKIHVVGQPQYDFYFSPAILSRADFFNTLGIPEKASLIVYASMGSTFSSFDWHIVDLLEEYRLRGDLGVGVELLVRFQPNDFLDQSEIDKRPWLHYQYPGIRFDSKRGVDWDMSKNDLEELRATLTHLNLLISYASSISVDAAIFDKPIININFEMGKSANLEKLPTQYYLFDHYKKALRTGGIRLVSRKEDFLDTIREYLVHPEHDREGRKRLRESQCAYLDGFSAKRVAGHIKRMLDER